MRVLMIGGTRFIGRAIVRELEDAGHEVMLLHRGKSEPKDLSHLRHVHASRGELRPILGEIEGFAPEVLVDTCALGRRDTQPVLQSLAWIERKVVLSSCDVYRAYGSAHEGNVTDAVPLTEAAPLRSERFPYRGQIPGMEEYEKLDVEELYAEREGTICRLPIVYGERDYQRREEFVLSRVRAGRERMPVGEGSWLISRGYVGDVARGVRLAMENDRARSLVFNLAEPSTMTVRLWAEAIIEAAEATLELVRVKDSSLPGDLGSTASIAQHVLVDSSRARHLLGWKCSAAEDTIKRSVAWHLEHPPDGDQPGFEADDRALESA